MSKKMKQSLKTTGYNIITKTIVLNEILNTSSEGLSLLGNTEITDFLS